MLVAKIVRGTFNAVSTYVIALWVLEVSAYTVKGIRNKIVKHRARKK